METPIGTAIVVCDQVITEAGTNKKTLVGTFNSINAKTVPCIHPAMTVFVSLTNGQGEMTVTLVCKFMDTNEIQFKTGTDVRFESPNHVADVLYILGNVPFKHFGLHCLEILVGETCVLESRFNVVEKKKDEQQ